MKQIDLRLRPPDVEILRIKEVLPAEGDEPPMIWATAATVRSDLDGREIVAESVMIGAETLVEGIDGEMVPAAELLIPDDVIELHPDITTGGCALRLVGLADA